MTKKTKLICALVFLAAFVEVGTLVFAAAATRPPRPGGGGGGITPPPSTLPYVSPP